MTQPANDRSGTFTPGSTGGVFDIRVKVECADAPLGSSTNNYSLASAIRGAVDTNAAKPVNLHLL